MEFKSIDPVYPLLEDLHHQQEQLFQYAKSRNISTESIHLVLRDICERISITMNCERVSIWLFDENKKTLTAQNIFEAGVGHISELKKLYASDTPYYFQAILNNRLLAVEDISEHTATRELLYNYFQSGESVQSLLDATILLSRGVGGVICCETGTKRSWTTMDKIVLSSIADMLTFVFDRLYRLTVEERVHMLAYTDVLTGLDNENAFNEKVNERFQCEKTNEHGVFIYFVVDQFSDIQSVFGREGGEKILVKTAERLSQIFPKPSLTTRIGFDHFLVYYPLQNDMDESELNLERVAMEFKKPMIAHGQEIFLSFSYGISYYPKHASTVTEGIQTARLALDAGQKKSKRKSRGLFEPYMHEEIKETVLSEMNLRKGLDANEFRLYYQPQVATETGELKGLEALIRWQHPEKGLISPGEFIELAESTGLIIPIGEWVIKEAFSQLCEWRRQGLTNLTVSINLSPRHFLHSELLSYLHKCLIETGVPAKCIILEITENVAMEDQEFVKQRMKSIVDMGFNISVDDFGTGYSAFIYLQRFSIQEIKIDRQFINGISTDPKSAVIIETIVHLGKMLGLKILAEGVETREQWEKLKEIGCHEIQGFYFSKPLSFADINCMLVQSIQKKRILLPIE